MLSPRSRLPNCAQDPCWQLPRSPKDGLPPPQPTNTHTIHPHCASCQVLLQPAATRGLSQGPVGVWMPSPHRSLFAQSTLVCGSSSQDVLPAAHTNPWLLTQAPRQSSEPCSAQGCSGSLPREASRTGKAIGAQCHPNPGLGHDSTAQPPRPFI